MVTKKACLIILLAVGYGCLSLPLPLCQGAGKDTLVVCLGSQPLTTLNPAHTTSRQVLVLYHNWGDTLLYRDPATRRLVPCLAESYRWPDAKTIEFKLRKGVRFHNGEAFDAQSVSFSMDLLKAPDSLVARYLEGFDKAEVIDDATVRIRTSAPHPTALEAIANVLYIYPPGYYRDAGKERFADHPIGTGPYRFSSRAGSSEVRFTANPDYFGGPKGQPGIPHVKAVILPEEMLQIERMVSGELDLLRATDFYQEQIPFIKNIPELKVTSVPSLRLTFLTMDTMGRSGVGFFKDKRVRMAVNHALHRQRIIREGYQGYAEEAHSATSPLHFGHEPNVTRYAYDPAKARELLKEAGYPQGFAVDFFAAIKEGAAEEIARDLSAVGIRAKLHFMAGDWAGFYKKFLKGELPLALMTWGSYSIFDAGAILNPFFMEGAPGCYGSLPEVSRMLNEANQTLDQARRQALFSRVQKIIAEEAFWAPVCATQSISVKNRRLSFEPAIDEIDRYHLASWD